MAGDGFFTLFAARRFYLVGIHSVETYVKWLAVGRRATVAAAGNIFLGGVAFVALVLDSWLDGFGPLSDLLQVSEILSGEVAFFVALGWTVSSVRVPAPTHHE